MNKNGNVQIGRSRILYLKNNNPAFYREEALIGWRKYAKLLPKNELAKTPQALALMRLGRQSAERERISENSSNLPTSLLTIPVS
ncbi:MULTISPECIES: hypothetical protein [unclassified Bacillus (in: firmicutes)]|uniref:hypothetical protein n=1 Tax=unclassified Bacillus (in: firmicutes) TaxID=185979 RepID=UPI001BE688C1|nr:MULTISPECIES: hypothetical protein [unclassified Bacillus (in: firmicutes)]MBT2617565.1 hypothetical protein [Bacillus sp. ISL-78]MBT2631624.1 hypothetical protein [Bacillus sp. ISL-101]MBT2715858.1 hypothetical protein [Bacillus sp. ISL-57]